QQPPAPGCHDHAGRSASARMELRRLEGAVADGTREQAAASAAWQEGTLSMSFRSELCTRSALLQHWLDGQQGRIVVAWPHTSDLASIGSRLGAAGLNYIVLIDASDETTLFAEDWPIIDVLPVASLRSDHAAGLLASILCLAESADEITAIGSPP